MFHFSSSLLQASAPLVAADAVVEPVKPATNLKLLAGKLECLLKLIKESKLAVVCPPGLEKIMPFIVTGLASANAQVRNTAQQCAFEVFRLVNNEIEPHLKGVKPAVMSVRVPKLTPFCFLFADSFSSFSPSSRDFFPISRLFLAFPLVSSCADATGWLHQD